MNKLLSIQTIFGLTDKLSGPMRQINDTVGKFRERTKAATVAGKLFDRGMTDAYRPLGAFGRAAEAAHRSQSLMVRGLSTSWGVLSGTTAKLTALAGSIGAVYGAQRLVRSVIGTSAQFETYGATLETTLGSAEKAQEALAWVQQFAKTTPYEMAGVTEAFIKLKAYGLDPMNGMLRDLGDASAGMGKPLMMSVEAIADAVMLENERLKEFGIKASVNKKAHEVTYTWVDTKGKQFAKTIDSTNQQLIASTLQTIWSSKFAGAMEKRSRTWEGMVSNMSDTWTGFLAVIGRAGVFDRAKRELDSVLSRFSAFVDSAAGQRFAKRISDGMVRAINVLSAAFERLAAGDVRGVLAGLRAEFEGLARQANLAGVWTDLRDALSGLAGVARVVRTVFGGIESTLDRITGNGTQAMAWIVGMQVAARAFLGVGLGTALAGIGKVLITVAGLASGWGAAVLAVGAAAATVIANWEPLKSWFTGFLDSQRQGFTAMRDDLFGAFEAVKAKILGVFDAIGERLTSFVTRARDTLRGLWGAISSSDGTEFGVPKALKQSFRVSPAAPPGYSDFIGRMGSEFGVRGDLLRTIFGRESSAGRNAGYNTTDSNAKKGTPSFGPFQFIEPTFNRFHKAASAARPDVFARLGQRDWQNWHQQAAVAAWAFANGKAGHWSTYKGGPIREPREYRLGRGEQSVRVENEITIIQDDRRQRVMTKTGGDGSQKARVNVGKNRFGLARGVA